ncbi:MaoC/PaaZ C-terminal domain-containing protein [Sphaerimonospora mesophila]|uniref:MaoC/PaaZ C-terminal domain-containing protein n=1 Tax=Sphaerimonospora mesophila TaxID=37483 RepID=UPI0006E42CC9
MTTPSTSSKENVEAGLELPPLHFDVSLTTLAKDVAGTRDIYPIHHDREFARSNGARDIFLNTMWYQGFLGRYVTDWAGSNSFVRKLGFDMRGTNCPGDRLTAHGKVQRVYREDGRALADLDVRIDNQHQQDTVVARITVELG